MSIVNILLKSSVGSFDDKLCIAPLVGAALVSGGASILGGLLGSKGQSDTNATNLQIARETNQANRENQEYQNEWNLEMWNKQNEYNTPTAQRQRLEDAGLNPIFYGLDGTGNAGALQSAPFTAVNGFPMQNSAEPLAQSLQNVGLTSADTYSKLQAGRSSGADADYTRTLNEIEKQMKSGKLELQNLSIKQGLINLDVSEQTLSNMAIQAEKLNKEIAKIDADIDIAYKGYDLAKMRYELDKDAQEFNKKLASQQMDLAERQFAEQVYKNRQEFAIAWYQAHEQHRAVDVQLLSVNNQGKLIQSNIQINNGKLKLQSYEQVESMSRSTLNYANAYKAYHDAMTPSGILGDLYQFADDVQYCLNGEKAPSAIQARVNGVLNSQENGVVNAINSRQ